MPDMSVQHSQWDNHLNRPVVLHLRQWVSVTSRGGRFLQEASARRILVAAYQPLYHSLLAPAREAQRALASGAFCRAVRNGSTTGEIAAHAKFAVLAKCACHFVPSRRTKSKHVRQQQRCLRHCRAFVCLPVQRLSPFKVFSQRSAGM